MVLSSLPILMYIGLLLNGVSLVLDVVHRGRRASRLIQIVGAIALVSGFVQLWPAGTAVWRSPSVYVGLAIGAALPFAFA